MGGQPEESQPTGLVICSISDRQDEVGIAEKLNEATNKFPKLEKKSVHSRLPDYYFEASPASIQLSRKELPSSKSGNYSPRQAITNWSKKSRSNMLKTLFALDYSPLFADIKRTPVMVTLTYPGEWESVAPNGQATKRHLSIFRKRYLRAFDEAFNGVWKLEFQRRGAPHIHILTSVKSDLGLFQLWVSKTWAEIVNHPDEKQKEKHLKAGTQVQAWYDFFRDKPYLIAHYFGKHASANKRGVKEYQNRPPSLWLDAGSIGRFWGYWGLTQAKAKVRLSRDASLFMQRTLRRWHEANSSPKKVRVRRVNQKTGVIVYRWATRPHKRLTHQGGYISVPDGVGMTETLLEALRAFNGVASQPLNSPSQQSPEKPSIIQVAKKIVMAAFLMAKKFVCRFREGVGKAKLDKPP
jgi:hypothetical protein